MATIHTTFEPIKFSQLNSGDEVMVANRFLTRFWRTTITSVEASLDPRAVIVKFNNPKNLRNFVIDDDALNRGNIIYDYNHYIVATNKENFQKAAIELLSVRKRQFNELLLEIRLKPTLVGTNELPAPIYEKAMSSIRMLDLMEITLHNIYFNQAVGKQELKDKFLLEEIHGTMHYAYSSSIAPLMTLDHADENFFREARQLFKKQQHKQAKWIDEFLKDDTKQNYFPIY